MFDIKGRELKKDDIFYFSDNPRYRFEVFSNDGVELKYFPVDLKTGERSEFPLTEWDYSFQKIRHLLSF